MHGHGALEGSVDLAAVDAGLCFDLGQAGVGREHLDRAAAGREDLALCWRQRARVELRPACGVRGEASCGDCSWCWLHHGVHDSGCVCKLGAIS
jgi:hypothetical protein